MEPNQQLSPSKLVGSVLGKRFRLTTIVGQPGTCTVFAGQDLQTSAPVQVKVLCFDTRSEPELFESAITDANALAGLAPSSNVVQVLDAGQVSTNALYIALQTEAGKTLDDWLDQQGQMPANELLRVGLSLTKGLAHLHQHGVVHGQVQPGDFVFPDLRDSDILAKIQNYGISRLTTHPVATQSQAPEQVVGQANSLATDVYALGCLLFDLFADVLGLDRPSFPFISPIHPSAGPTKTRDEQIMLILKTCLAKQPEDRFQSAQAIESELEIIVANQDPNSPLPSLPPLSEMPKSDSFPTRPAQLPGSVPIAQAPVSGQQQGMSNLPESTQHFDNSAWQSQNQGARLLSTMDHHGKKPKPKPRKKDPKQSGVPQLVLACLAVGLTAIGAWWILSERDLNISPPSKQVASASLASVHPEPQLPAPPSPPAPVAQPVQPPKPPAPEPRSAKLPPAPPKKAPEKKPEKSRAPAYLTQLSDKDIRDALRPTRTRIHARCPQPDTKTTVNAEIRVLPNGKVARVQLTAPLPENELGRCIVRHALETSYPQRARHQPSIVQAAFHVGGQRRGKALR